MSGLQPGLPHRCRQCGLYRETRSVGRFGSGTYKRAGHWRPASICEGCARSLLAGVHEGQRSTDRWSIRGLRTAWGVA